MTHAGIPPHWTKKDLIGHSNKLSSNLVGNDYRNFLKKIFGNKPDHPDKCKKDEEVFLGRVYSQQKNYSEEKNNIFIFKACNFIHNLHSDYEIFTSGNS